MELGEVTPYKLAAADPASLIPIDKNAHYMSKRVYEQLVDNIKRDGNLSSMPFCWKRTDGKYVVLSGNHRVECAREAGVPMILLLYTDAALSTSQIRAHQIAHNALVGKDNPQTLRELYEEIGAIDLKIYSGIDDATLKTLMPQQLSRLMEGQLRFEEMHLLFMPTEIARIGLLIERLDAEHKHRFAARVDDFDRFFDLLLSYKEAHNIVNSATALLAMCEIVEAHLAQQVKGKAPKNAARGQLATPAAKGA